MIHPHTELRFISPTVGYGVVATKFIPKGTITWALDKLDRIFTPAMVNSMEKIYQDIIDKYCYRNSDGDFVLCWDISRFVNHSFNSSCISTAYDFELAVRDIHPGEELTDDYGYLNVSEPFDCLPEPGSLRNRVMPEDLMHYHQLWDTKLIDAFKNYNAVEQPLKIILDKGLQLKAEEIGKGKLKMDSILNCYFDESKMLRKVAK